MLPHLLCVRGYLLCSLCVVTVAAPDSPGRTVRLEQRMSTRVLTRIATLATGAALGAVMTLPAAQAQTTTAWAAADTPGSNSELRQGSLAPGRNSADVNVRFPDLRHSNQVNDGATALQLGRSAVWESV